MSFASRCVGGQYIKWLNSITYKTSQVPLVKVAGLTAQLLCPSLHCEGGICALVRKADIDRLKNPKNSKAALACEAMMNDVRQLLKDCNISRTEQVRLRGAFCIRLFLHLANRSAESSDKRTFKDVGEIARVLFITIDIAIALRVLSHTAFLTLCKPQMCLL